MYIVYYTLYPYITVMVRFTIFVLCDVVLILCVIFLSVVKSAKYYSTYYDV
jgi:hypothetical protein